MKASAITRTVHSQGFALAVCAVVLLCVRAFFAAGLVAPVTGDYGIALPSACEWFSPGWPELGMALTANAAVALMALLLNKRYNVLRSVSYLYIALYAVMMLGTPRLLGQFYSGPLLALAVGAGLYIMFGCYRSAEASGKVFLVFAMLSGMAATQYCFALYLLAFLAVCAQMRVLNGRTLVAAAIGIVVPWWILLGFGIVRPADLHMPGIQNIFAGTAMADIALTLGAVGLSAVLLMASMALNFFKTIAYNGRSRAFNGSITIVALFTIIGMAADFANFAAYVPLLDFCAAIQTAHYFSTHRADRSWIPVVAVIVVYTALFICQIRM